MKIILILLWIYNFKENLEKIFILLNNGVTNESVKKNLTNFKLEDIGIRQQYILGKFLKKNYKELFTNFFKLNSYSKNTFQNSNSFIANSFSLLSNESKKIKYNPDNDLLMPNFMTDKNYNFDLSNIFNKGNEYFPSFSKTNDQLIEYENIFCPNIYKNYIKKNVIELKKLDDEKYFNTLYENISKSDIYKKYYNDKKVNIDNVFEICNQLINKFYSKNQNYIKDNENLFYQISFFLNIFYNKLSIIYPKFNKFKLIGENILDIINSKKEKNISMYSFNEKLIIQILQKLVPGNLEKLLKYYKKIYNNNNKNDNYLKFEQDFIPFPFYGSSLILEFYNNNNKKYIKILFDGNYLNLKKDSKELNLEEFEKIIITNFMSEEINYKCKNIIDYNLGKIITVVSTAVFFIIMGFIMGFFNSEKKENIKKNN